MAESIVRRFVKKVHCAPDCDVEGIMGECSLYPYPSYNINLMEIARMKVKKKEELQKQEKPRVSFGAAWLFTPVDNEAVSKKELNVMAPNIM